MIDNKKFFENLKIWSKRKHRLLEKYLPPFSAKVASTTINREVYCVDGFAGAAKYDDGSEGSPVLMAKFSHICSRWSKPINLRIINVEPEMNTFNSLEDRTRGWKSTGVVENINARFDEVVSTILTKVGTAPTLFFIDPFGPTDVRFSHLIPILQRNSAITELIINFDTDGLYRIACAAVSKNNNPKTAQTNAEIVTSIIGSNNWLNQFVSSKLTTETGEEILLREYISNLSKYGFNVADYAIKEALDKKPKYHFVCCTRHFDGIILMNDFVREEEDLIYGEHIEDSPPLFQMLNLADQEISSRREKLKSIMQIYLENNVEVTRNKVIKDLVKEHFGYFHGKDYRNIFKSFIDLRWLTTTDNKTKIDDRIYKYSISL